MTMPIPRYRQVSVDATRSYHCISRCVRRAFLCGDDRCSGKNFDHRRGWLVDRIKELAGIFAIDICAYAVMSNHFHLVLRIWPERAEQWSEAEVVERWRQIFPQKAAGLDVHPVEERKLRLERWRERLSDLSWFMRCLNEAIARRANREDRCTGRFWEGRFRSQALLDEGALLTCMSYVDLNPIRAGMAATLEESDFTSIQERLRAKENCDGAEPRSVASAPDQGQLVPFASEPGADHSATPELSAPGSESLPIKLRDYARVLEALAGLVREGEAMDLSPELGAPLRELGLDPEGFVKSVRGYARSFFGMVGEAHRIEMESNRRGYRRRMGLGAARRLYRSAA